MYKDILHFWFEEIDKSKWFVKDTDFDQLIISNYSKLHSKALNCELYQWRTSAKGRLAEIIILDQFSRNMFRDNALSFAADALALALTQEAISDKADDELSEVERNFLYMPFMHSESLAIHKVGLDLFKNKASEATFKFERRHKEIIEKFGRYPHRNSILGRESSQAEVAFLQQPGSAF